ncbi:hypothetical protein KFK09_028422 [Dendrobium nobile]|uniref:Uncharacterized protein n=1 Tax=Dendrobium nobile TaxID=94219 RepID=A0A8T3A1W0_DENNO|nr:hypothetical protein KFK09_028422 [Dendrobium nobile]
MNGLPPSYNPFKAAIRTSPLLITLDNLYSLLCSEEITVNQDIARETASVSGNTALYATSGNQSRNQYSRRATKNQNPSLGSSQNPTYSPSPNNQAPTTQARPICQICNKIGHSALNCWHHNNPKFTPTNPRSLSALLAQPNSAIHQDWLVDSGASNHLTPDLSNIQNPSSYLGQDSVSVANGSQLPVLHFGQGLLPIPDTPFLMLMVSRLRISSTAVHFFMGVFLTGCIGFVAPLALLRPLCTLIYLRNISGMED